MCIRDRISINQGLVEADLVKPAEWAHVPFPYQEKIAPNSRPRITRVGEMVEHLLQKLQPRQDQVCRLDVEEGLRVLRGVDVAATAPDRQPA
eukprot:1274974-Pyramimonas_sp.AAC.1